MMILTPRSQLAAWINHHALFANLPIWGYALLALVDTHVPTACVTLYLHRAQTHRSISFHGAVEHFMRFWLWARTAMPTKEWVAVHRCHHAHVDTAEDPHSPIFYGIWRVVLKGTALYHKAAHNQAVIEQYGKGTPDDVLERRLYTPLSILGPTLTLITNVFIFGMWGIGMWLVEMAWIPFFAAGVINGLGHWWGYRNFNTPDQSETWQAGIGRFSRPVKRSTTIITICRIHRAATARQLIRGWYFRASIDWAITTDGRTSGRVAIARASA